MIPSGESIRVVHPLFQEEGCGSNPTSPLQLEIGQMPIKMACLLNSQWHSRLPQLTNWQGCEAFGAMFGGQWYAVAIWGDPVSATYVHKPYLELRRMAIHESAPSNTGSRMLKVMRLLIVARKRGIEKLISYQDTEVHKGTIYKAAGWKAIGHRKGGANTWTHSGRDRVDNVATGDKIRWEYDLRANKSVR